MSNSSVKEFENLFQILSETEKKEIVDHINEGYFVGPFNKKVSKGLYVGPLPTSLHHSKCCPTCGHPL